MSSTAKLVGSAIGVLVFATTILLVPALMPAEVILMSLVAGILGGLAMSDLGE